MTIRTEHMDRPVYRPARKADVFCRCWYDITRPPELHGLDRWFLTGIEELA